MSQYLGVNMTYASYIRNMQENWWMFLIFSAFLFWLYLDPLYPSEDLSDYKSKVLEVWEEKIEEFTASRNTKYYELAIYAVGSNRLFIRSPHRDEILNVQSDLFPRGVLTIHFLVKEENNRGNRVVNIKQDGFTIYNIKTVVHEQEKIERIIMVFGFIFFGLGIVLYYRHQRGKPQ